MKYFLSALALPFLVAQSTAAQSVNRVNCGVVPGQNLVVFVGKKIEIREFTPELDPGAVLLDNAFRAKYRVLEVFCGQLDTQDVEFEVYDHYGTPHFAEFETVLLFLTRYGKRLVHQKYLYAPVYETANGSWAGCGDPYQFEPSVHRGPIRAKRITYRHPVTFSVRGLSEKDIQERYPAAFFKRRGDTVVCHSGALVDDLFRVKRNGVLRARGLFR